MGLRTASVRRPHVAVMAPALTETTQSQSFRLTPKVHTPTSSIDKYEVDKYHSSSKKTYSLSDDHLFPLNGNVISNAVCNLNTLELASDTILQNKCLKEQTGASDKAPSRNLNMNNCPIPMGDQGDKMGLQKTGIDSVSTIHKDKSAPTEVDQLLNNLSSVIPSGTAGNIGQNVDEIMQVIKSLEGCNDRMNNLNNTSNDLNSENDEVFPITGTDLTNNLSSFEKAFLDDVDMMNMNIEDQQDELDTVDNIKESQAKDILADLQKKHIKVERRLDFLRRRIYKLQTRYMGQHISGEIAGVFENVQRSLKRLKELNDNPKPSDLSTDIPGPSKEASPPEKIKPISYGSTKSLIRKLEMTAILQANAASKQRHSARYFGSGSVEPPTFRSNISGMITIPTFPTETKQELQKVSGLLHTELGLVQEEVDSEATESSSGGESCDEMQNYNNPHQQYLSIQKRALWRYSTDRAAIAARWTWLQAQISDLEYRIRQHTDLHRQIRTSKGAITLGDVSPPASVPSSPTAVNGYRGQLPGNSPISSKAVDSSPPLTSSTPEHQCARTRPLVKFKKRKLLQTTGLHAVSKKAARPSTVRCGCVPPDVPCALCTGRTDPTHPRDTPETLSKAERIALLDPCFHPVFSLPEDVSQSIHLEAIMKTPEWQQRSIRMKNMKLANKSEKLEKPLLEDRTKKQLEHRKKYGRLLKPSTMSALSAKIKNKIRGRKTGRHPSLHRLNRKRHTAKVAMAQLQALAADGVDEEVESIGNSSNTASKSIESPSSSPLLQMQSISGYNKRNRTDSYDIDNIVIPYSVAASTRVEKLKYKEILTPKWRIADPDSVVKYEVKNNGVAGITSQDSDFEDVTDEAVIARHDRCEHDEKKKFLSYLKLPIGYGRSRSHKRTDSRAESSGANTPDPMSPHQVENQDNTMSPMASPPATPLSMNVDDAPLPSISVLRRRTISQSRFVKDKEMREETRCNTPDVIEISPFDRRTFPLSEETYDKMLKNMPENHQFKTNFRAQDSSDVNNPDDYIEGKVDSPGSESTESALGEEDPNDPEWLDMERSRDRHKR